MPHQKGQHRKGPGAEPPLALQPGLDQQPVLDHPVIADAHRHKDHRSAIIDGPLLDITQQADPRPPHPPVKAEATFGKDRLGRPFGRGHLHPSRQHPTIETVMAAAPDEIGAHGPEQPRNGPDPRPFTHGIRQGRAVGHQPGHQDIIHVRAMVHHKDHRCSGVDAFQRRVHPAHPHPIQQFRQPARGADGETEIDQRRKTRHDFTRIISRLLDHDRAGAAGLGRAGGNRLKHIRIEGQAHDLVVACHQLERLDRPGQALVQLRDRPLHPAAQEPPNRRKQEMRGEGHRGKAKDQQQ